jgi:endonuclease/exonuclease/phosphatase family metal-dependent hydrolase
MEDANGQQIPSNPGQKILRMLTWNIEGLNKDLVVERAMAVCDEIESRVADVVYLQEIIPKTWDAITKRLQSKYYFYRDEAPHRYYHILMIRIDSEVVAEGDVQVMKFPNTTQSRLLLHIPVKFHNHEMHLLTSHLESLSINAIKRMNQLSAVFNLMSSLSKSQGKICLFGGDMNITDLEVEEVGVPALFGDLWEMCGFDPRRKFTWDSTEPWMRLDRLYMCPKGSALQPTTFDLVGESLLDSYGVLLYASDHLGVWAEFELKEESVVEEKSGKKEDEKEVEQDDK